MAKYSDSPRFAFSFHGGLSHDSINEIEAADEDVLAWLEELKTKHLLDNTILIVMSDHGIRYIHTYLLIYIHTYARMSISVLC